jgi:hypothetical protein
MKNVIVRAPSALLLWVALLGCSSAPPVAQARLESGHVFEKNYSLGVERSALAGAPIVRVRDYWELARETDILAASASFTLQHAQPPNVHADVAAGTLAEVRGTTTRGGKTFRLAWIKEPIVWSKEPTEAMYLFLLNDDGSFEGSAIDSLNAKMGFSFFTSPATVRFLPRTSVDASRNFVNFELIYGGVADDSITLLYREYTRENLAKPANSQSLVFPKGSATIRFREIGISVLEASNEKLRYAVQTDGLK